MWLWKSKKAHYSKVLTFKNISNPTLGIEEEGQYVKQLKDSDEQTNFK